MNISNYPAPPRLPYAACGARLLSLSPSASPHCLTPRSGALKVAVDILSTDLRSGTCLRRVATIEGGFIPVRLTFQASLRGATRTRRPAPWAKTHGYLRKVAPRPRWAQAFILACLVLSAFLPLLTVRAAEPTDQEVLKKLTTEQPRDVAVKKGLEYLRKLQKADGSVGDRVPTAMSAMAVMAHFAAGYSPADRQHGPWLRKSINYVLSKQNADGYFGESDGSRMYGHGIATLMLAEALGMPRDDEMDEVIRKALKKAVQVTVNAALIKKAPEHAGGWRYAPDATDSDLSLSGWQLLGLHATQQVGIPVPESVIAGAVEYTRKMISPEGKVGYQNPNDDHPALRGLALLALAIGHQEKTPMAKKVTERMSTDPIAWKGPHFFYRAYYDAVGLSRAMPEEWEKYLAKYEAVLLPHQLEDGSFDTSVDDDAKGAGAAYSTSMSIMALAVERHVLPAYQR